MCGITGVINLNGNNTSPKDFKTALNSIKYRGPDSTGSYFDTKAKLGIQRLKIIDLVTGEQPISNENGQLVVVFNGEIYNYREIRDSLLKKGHKFKTQSDTEVLLHLYEEYGPVMPKLLNGMFSFAIWDKKKEELFLARDHAGIKPLYYYHDNDTLIFGSEIKTIISYPKVIKRLNDNALELYFALGYLPGDVTMFNNVFKLLPGTSLVFSKKGMFLNRWWEISPKKNNSIEYLDNIFDDAVKKQLVADVPVGIFLSGGLDSSLLTYYATKQQNQIKTFSITFSQPGFDESSYARQAANFFHTNHYEIDFSSKDIIDNYSKLSSLLDEPLADISIFLNFKLSALAKKHVTVALSGEGGDELFGGYQSHQPNPANIFPYALPKLARSSLACLEPYYVKKPKYYKHSGEFIHFIEGYRYSSLIRHLYLSTCIDSQKTFNVLNKIKTLPWFNGYLREINNLPLSFSQKRQYLDLKTFLVDDLLFKADRSSMFNSLEIRVPFLDPRIINFAFSQKINHANFFQTKTVLRRMAKNKIPNNILNRPKMGFSLPKSSWIRTDLHNLVKDQITSTRLSSYFDKKDIDRAFDEHCRGIQNHANFLWMLTSFSSWLEHWA